MNMMPIAFPNGLTVVPMQNGTPSNPALEFQSLVADFVEQPETVPQPAAAIEFEPTCSISIESGMAGAMPDNAPAPRFAEADPELQIDQDIAKPVNRSPATPVAKITKLDLVAVVPCAFADNDDTLDDVADEQPALTGIVITAVTASIIPPVLITPSLPSNAKDAPIAVEQGTIPKSLLVGIPAFPVAQAPTPNIVFQLPSGSQAPGNDAAITGHLDLARDTMWLDQLAREIFAVASNDGKLRFTLSPPALGNLDVAISTDAGGVSIQLQPSTENAARIFAAEQPRLAEELRQSGLKLASNDLISGNQMNSPHQQSQPRSSAHQTALRVSGRPPFATRPTPSHSKRLQGRFA
jgi:flagellar hook-length control protein FliK